MTRLFCRFHSLLSAFPLFVAAALCFAGSTLRAGVYLSAKTFTTNNLPYIWTDEPMPANYKLRAKISGVAGYGSGFHAANNMNNSWTQLDACPPLGSYYVDLYWVKYDSSGTTVVQIGSASSYYITITAADTPLVPISTSAFSYAGHQTQSYTVPANVNCILVTAWGGGGGGYFYDGSERDTGGAGALVTTACNVQAGEQITITVGSGGSSASESGQAGWPGGGSGPGIVAGGGYTRIQTATGDIWVGGGGGTTSNVGGDGGNGGTPNGRGGDGPGGGGATPTSGGTAGPTYGQAGGRGQGGSGTSGGGGGYYGGGGGGYGPETYNGTFYNLNGGGGGGSSAVLGDAYFSTYTTAINGDQSGMGGGNGGVVIRAYHITTPTIPAVYTFAINGTSNSYNPPASAAYVVAKVWGTGGGSGGSTLGGAGAFVLGIYNNPGPLAIYAGAGGYNAYSGGQITRIMRATGTGVLIAGGGGSGGTAPGGNGGVGGAPNGGNGGDGYGTGSGGGGTIVTVGQYATGGTGGTGDGVSYTYDDSGNVVDSTNVGAGNAGSNADTGGYTGSSGGAGGQGGDDANPGYDGGAGGSGFGGGGGGGGGDNSQGGGGGGGGGSGIAYADGVHFGGGMTNFMLAGQGRTPAATTDPDYPGGGVGFGGTNGGAGGPGAVVLISYFAVGSTPTITAATAQSFGQGHATDVPITFSNAPVFYTATGLPPGLALDSLTGHVTGTPTTQGTFTSTITATNPLGAGQSTVTWTITPPDATPPTAPTGLQVAATSFTTLNLLWTAPTDNVSVYGYEIQQNGVTIGTSSSASFAVSGLVFRSSYSFNVRARDPAGNWSSWSAPVAVTMTDLVPPTAPGALNYAEDTATTVTLVWRAAMDNVGVVGYTIYRGTQAIGTTSDVAFVDSGLTANTAYSYTVKAFDAAGNVSPASNTLTVTTTQDFSADSDHDGIPDVSETALGTNGSAAASADTTNQTQQNIHRPTQ